MNGEEETSGEGGASGEGRGEWRRSKRVEKEEASGEGGSAERPKTRMGGRKRLGVE